MVFKCDNCGNEFERPRAEKRGQKTFCSKKCALLLRWKDPVYRASRCGIRKSQETKAKISSSHRRLHNKEKLYRRGYVLIEAPEHPRRYKGRVREHILVAERALGRYLKDDEVVHHINGIHSDNRNCNLLICKRDYHSYLHATMNGLGKRIHARVHTKGPDGRFISNPKENDHGLI